MTGGPAFAVIHGEETGGVPADATAPAVATLAGGAAGPAGPTVACPVPFAAGAAGPTVTAGAARAARPAVSAIA